MRKLFLTIFFIRNPEYQIFVCICWYNHGVLIQLKYLTWCSLWKDWYLINWLWCGCPNKRKVSGHICVKWWCQRASANMANPLFHNCWAKVTIYARLMINHSCKFIEIFSSKETEEWSSVAGPFLTITQLQSFNVSVQHSQWTHPLQTFPRTANCICVFLHLLRVVGLKAIWD